MRATVFLWAAYQGCEADPAVKAVTVNVPKQHLRPALQLDRLRDTVANSLKRILNLLSPI
jgi:hypothetical protein